LFPWSSWVIGLNVAAIIWGAVHLYRHSGGRGDTGKVDREWTTDDLVACVLSALTYFNGLAATALVLINNPTGWILAGATVLELILMFRIIDPKLKLVSSTFEKKQKQYVEELDRIVKWE
jgi:hypothetical protein